MLEEKDSAQKKLFLGGEQNCECIYKIVLRIHRRKTILTQTLEFQNKNTLHTHRAHLRAKNMTKIS